MRPPALAALLALAAPALAQDAPAPPSRQVEEIVVTAQKTEQSLQDVPISVTAIDGDFVAEAGLTSLVDIVQYAPNVQFYEGQSLFASFNIRGFATPPLGFGLEPSVGLVIDDVAYGRSTYAQDGVFDLERLEVLRGPQGTLFGRNTVAGVMNMTTAEPSFEPNGKLTLGVGSLDDRRIEGGVSWPLVGDVLAGRLAFRAHSQDLDIFNTTRDEENDLDEIAGRLKLLWEPTSDLSFRLTAWTSEQNVHGAIVQLQQATPRSLEVFREFDPETESDEFDGRTSIDEETESGRRVYAIAPKATWTIGSIGPISDLELTAIGAWSKIDNPYVLDPDFSPIHLGKISADGVARYEQLSLELRATGTTPAPFGFGEGLDFLVGAYADTIDVAIRQRFDVDLNGALPYLAAGAKSEPSDAENLLPGVPPELFAVLDEITGENSLPDVLTGPAGGLVVLQPIPPALATEKLLSETKHEAYSVSGFFQTVWRMTKQWELTTGARLSFDEQEADIFSRAPEGLGVGSALADQEDFEAHLDLSETNISPKVALTYHWTDEISLFANVARGFKAGGYDNAPLNDDHLQYEAETAISYETGIKSRIAGGAMMVNATAFWMELDDLQVRNFTGVTFTTDNADKSTSRGFELDFQWLPPLEGLTVGGGVGLTDAWFNSFPNGTAIAGSGEDEQDLSGRELPLTPKVSASLFPMLVFPVMPSWDLGGIAGVDFLFRSGRYLDNDLDPATYQDATVRLNARLGLLGGERWRVIFNAKNLTGEKERLIVIDQPLLEGNYVAFPLTDEPLFTVDFNLSFG